MGLWEYFFRFHFLQFFWSVFFAMPILAIPTRLIHSQKVSLGQFNKKSQDNIISLSVYIQLFCNFCDGIGRILIEPFQQIDFFLNRSDAG